MKITSEEDENTDNPVPIENEKSLLRDHNRIHYKDFIPQELTEILKTRKGNHKKLLDFIFDNQLNLQSRESNRDYPKTLMQRLLQEAGNGRAIVEKVLTSYICPSGDLDLDCNEFCAKFNFSGILDQQKPGTERRSIIDDLLLEINEYSENLFTVIWHSCKIAFKQTFSTSSKEIAEIENRHVKYEAYRGKQKG